MGFWDDLTGKTAAEASKAAAADTYAKQTDAAGQTYNSQQGAIAKLLGYGTDYRGGMDTLSRSYDPYRATGLQANDAYSRLLADPSSVRSLPGYQFAQDEGSRAIQHSAVNHLASGRTLKDLTRFGTGIADQTYGNQLARLMSGTQLGVQATGASNALQSAGLQGELGARTSAYQGDFNSAGTRGAALGAAAGTIGQGDVAAANARAAGSQNLLNAGLKIGGMALGAFGGNPLSALMGGGNGASISGGGGGYDPNTNLPLYSGGRPLYA